MSVRKIMQRHVTTIRPEDSLVKAVKLMSDHHIGNIVVIDIRENKHIPIGILTDRDIALYLAREGKIDAETTVNEVMSRSVILAHLDEGLYQVIEKMHQNGIRRMPVVNIKDHIEGIISFDDILALLAKEVTSLSKVIDNESRNEETRKFYSLEGEQPLTSI